MRWISQPEGQMSTRRRCGRHPQAVVGVETAGLQMDAGGGWPPAGAGARLQGPRCRRAATRLVVACGNAREARQCGGVEVKRRRPMPTFRCSGLLSCCSCDVLFQVYANGMGWRAAPSGARPWGHGMHLCRWQGRVVPLPPVAAAGCRWAGAARNSAGTTRSLCPRCPVPRYRSGYAVPGALPLTPEHTSSMVCGCTSGEAIAAPMLNTNHATTHRRRRFSDRKCPCQRQGFGAIQECAQHQQRRQANGHAKMFL